MSEWTGQPDQTPTIDVACRDDDQMIISYDDDTIEIEIELIVE